VLLISAKQADDGDTLCRVERLSKDSTGRRAIVLLMEGHDAMSSFVRLQMEYVSDSGRT
jgi:hypothetical protein